MEVLRVSKTSEWYLGSMSLSIAFCISLASVVALAAGEHFVLTCLSRGITADAVTSFSPDKASVIYRRVTVLLVGIVVSFAIKLVACFCSLIAIFDNEIHKG